MASVLGKNTGGVYPQLAELAGWRFGQAVS